MTVHELERNRAVRIAHNHARSGHAELAGSWLELADTFATTTPAQHARAEALLRAAMRTVAIPGQIDLDGKEHR